MAFREIILGSFCQVLFDKLSSLALGYWRGDGTNATLLDEWKGKLVTINAVLDDAEEKQLSGNPLVKQWLDDVKDLAYDMEDLLDDFEMEATQDKSEVESSTSRGQRKRKSSWLSRPRSLVSSPRVQTIKGRWEAIVDRKALLSLRENDAAYKSSDTSKRIPSTSLPVPKFLGREKDEAKILELLTGEAKNANSPLSIVSIVGMGGLGKTALAQRLFNNAEVNKCFEQRAWVCVSDVFNIIDITKTILQSITESSYENKDLNWLQIKLKDNLSRKKFLVVLDDVWNEDSGEWEALLKPFEAGARGSKIIVTTRNLSVVSITGASPYPLKELSIDDCKSLLAFHALGAPNFESHRGLETIGKELAEKCDGLPLAAKILGSALRDERNPDKWEDVLHNKMWDLQNGRKYDVLPVLKLSYVHLPPYLKRCFAYCAVFPKDYEIERDGLVLLWIAEGFLDGQGKKEDILKLGRERFDELVSRSFLQQSSVNTSKFSMHDLLNDLAKSIVGRTYFSIGESPSTGDKDHASLEKTRYASFILPDFVIPKCLRGYGGMKVLRSLTLMRIGDFQSSISNKVLHDLLTNLKYLRVFLLCHCDVTEIPTCIGDLKHLRYLNFSYTNIKSLPKSIIGLRKLQALILKGCEYLSTLPQGIAKLLNLQFLDIRDTKSLKEMPLGISNLENLTILTKFVVGPDKGSQLKELKNLPHLQGELFISELQRVQEVRDPVDVNFLQKRGLTNLSLHWDGCMENLEKQEVVAQEQVLNSLRPHTNLETLNISYYGGARFPSWLDGGSYSKVLSLCLRGCRNVTSLSSLGQLPSLKELSLEGLNALEVIDTKFYGGKRPFPSLTTLKFKDMSAWKDWSPYVGDLEEGVPFSYLQHLLVQECPLLVGTLPCRLEHLVKLEIRSCPHLNISNGAACLPSLCELYLEHCNKGTLRSLVNPASLTILRISNIAELVCFDPRLISCLVKLKELHIEWCGKLRYLWQDENEILNLTWLQKLFIGGCPQFTSFVAEGGAIKLPRNLERMELLDCESLEKFPQVHTLASMIIWKCPKLKIASISQNDASNNNATSQIGCQLTSFPCAEGELAIIIGLCEGVERLEEITMESLKSLAIEECENLRSLPQNLHMLSHLTQLRISSCPTLEIEDFPLLPINLSSLSLSHCPKIKSIASCNIVSCNNFTSLYICGCAALEIDEFPSLPITLSSLWPEGCPKIKSLPNQWHHLTSLVDIDIRNCPNIECFPKGGWPPNLQELSIRGCENVKQPVREWGLPFLTSLQKLWIDGMSIGGEGEKVSFPSDADAWTLLFPSSLTSLWIRDMREVERLSSGLRNHLSSLQSLWISFCPKLRDLPEDGLPPSLQRLSIYKCEKIPEDRYSKLAEEIPLVYADDVRYLMNRNRPLPPTP